MAFVANFFREYESVKAAVEKFTPTRAVKGKSASPRDGLREQSERKNLFSTSVIIKFVALLRVISGGDIQCAGTLIIPLIKTAGKKGGK